MKHNRYNLAAFIQYLGHSIFSIKSIVTGQKASTKEAYFQVMQIGKAEDYIKLRNGKRQIYTNLQEFGEIPEGYHSFSDIKSYKNIYLDIDAEKPNGMKDYAATEEEQAKAISRLSELREWLVSKGFLCGLELSTGNGAGIVLPIPETKAEPVFIAKLATFLKMVPGIDTSTFDPGRIIGIPGTINAKLETEGRKNRVRKVIGEIPERIEDQALLDFIWSLDPDQTALKEWAKKYNEPQHPPETHTATINADDIIDRLTGLFGSDPKLKGILDGNIEAYGKDRSRAEYGACGKLIKYGFTDQEIDYIMCHVSKIGKWQEEGDHYRFDQTLRKLREAEGEKETNAEPKIKEVSKDDPTGDVGFDPITGAICKVVEFENDDGSKKKFLGKISDCAVHIHTETRAKDETEFIFVGKGAVDKRDVKFTMKAADAIESRKFRAALTNAFGAKNKIVKLTFPMVQELSINPQLFQRVEVPTWSGNIPLLPGLNLAENIEFRLSPKIPAAVYDGDLDKAKDLMRTLLKVHRFVSIVVVTVFGSPAIARYRPHDRFGLGVFGMTGTLKTSTILAAMGVYGTGYLDGPKLKAGKGGSTVNGAMEIFAAAGFLPQLYDNIKAVDSKDSENYVSIMHAVLEGEEKARSRKDGGLRDSKEFLSTPINTGEVKPQEASTTARIFGLNWTRPNEKLLGEVQQSAALLPVIGYHWLRFLAETDFVLGKDFEAFRSKKMEEFLGLKYTNPGRLATIYTLLVAVWDLLEASPFGDVFQEAREDFKTALEEATIIQGQAVSEETEISRFLSGLEELIAGNPGLIMSKDGTKVIMGSIVGKWTEKGLFLLPSETLNELGKIRVFNQQPTVDSITQSLKEKGILIRGEKDKLKTRMRIGDNRSSGWHIIWPPVEGTPVPG